MIRAKNVEAYDMGVNLWLRQTEGFLTGNYRDMLWDVFKRIVNSTPQWSGKAVANWNMSIGSPDFTEYVGEGDDVGTFGHEFSAHKVGDRKWINVALARARPVHKSIRYRDKVFICNGVQGDDDDGIGTTNYLQDLQEPFYWRYKLREVNKPYETAQESVIIVATRHERRQYAQVRVGGESLDML